MSKSFWACFFVIFAFACHEADEQLPARQEDARAQFAVPQDGFHSANIVTPVGNFQKQVSIKGGEIECIQWSAKNCSPFHGKLNEDGVVSGTLANGIVAKLEIVD